MRLSLFFARRYLFARKSHSVINIVSAISAFTVAIPVMAMVVLLSVFNGFERLIHSMFEHFDPPIEITATRGKVFSADSLDQAALLRIEGVENVSFTLEETALFDYGGRQHIAVLKGVDSLFAEVVPIREMVVRGDYALKLGELDQALLGQGVAYMLAVGPTFTEPLTVYMPRRGRSVAVLPVDLYRRKEAFPAGIFALDGETDGKYVLVPLEFARSLLDYGPTVASAVAVGLSPGSDAERVRREIVRTLGDRFTVKTRFQQKAELYRLMQYEKWGIWFIILLVLVIASFSIVGSLVMIILDKRKDTATLVTLGADVPLIRRIFIREGLLISGAGTVAGIVLGVLLCLGQQHFGWVRMPGASFLFQAYPVEMRIVDLLGVVASVGVIDYLIARFTVAGMIRKGVLFGKG